MWSVESASGINSPVVGADGTVYSVYNSAGNSVGPVGRILAVNGSTGLSLWNFYLGYFPFDMIGSPAIANDTVYVGNADYTVFALNASTGKQVWAQYCGQYYSFTSPVVSPDDKVYLLSSDFNFDYALLALDGLSGTVLWKTEWSTEVEMNGSPTLGFGSIVYFGAYAFNATTGAQLWSFDAAQAVSGSATVGSKSMVFFGDGGGVVYALNASGSLIWNVSTGGAVTSSPSVGQNGTIYVGCEAGGIYTINETTGAVLDFFETGGISYSSPAIGADGTVFVGSMDSYVYAIKPGTTPSNSRTPTTTPSSSPTISHSPSLTPSQSPSQTATRSQTRTPTPTQTPSPQPSPSRRSPGFFAMNSLWIYLVVLCVLGIILPWLHKKYGIFSRPYCQCCLRQDRSNANEYVQLETYPNPTP